jgi:pimeloyl-ACP methyl ester carboxylesterase
MIVSPRSAPRRHRRVLVVLAAVVAVPLVALGLLLGAAKVVQGRFAATLAEPPGRLIDLGAHRLHLHCQGPVTPNAPTVVLEAGLGESSLTWAGVAPALTKNYRVCAYDRAGYGWSDPAPTGPSASGTVADLHRLLAAAGESPPYVLVGHSLGGVYARLFAYTYPGETAGLVLLDPSHEEMTSRLPADWQAHVRAVNVQAVADLTTPALLADFGLAAVFPQFAPADPRLPAETQATLRALGGAGGKGFRALAGEAGAIEAILAEVRAAQITDLDDLPLVVIKAGAVPAGPLPAGLSPFTPGYDLHAELAEQSSRGLLITLGEASHYVHYDTPAQVIGAITALLAEAAPPN